MLKKLQIKIGNVAYYRSSARLDGPRVSRPLALRLARAAPAQAACSLSALRTLICSGTNPALRAARPHRLPAPCAPAQTRASHCGRALFAWPYRGLYRRRAQHWRPPRHSTASSFTSASSSASTSLHLPKQQADATPKAHVAISYFKCFRCFKVILQVLYIDVAKVDRDVAHVIIAIHVWFKCMF
jgi:hypothetical protein